MRVEVSSCGWDREVYAHGGYGEQEGAFYVRLGIGKEREPKLVDITRTRKSHSEMAGMWMEKFLHIKLE